MCGMHARIARGHLVERNRCRSTAETTLLFVWNARTHCQGPPCVEKSSSVDCRDDPVVCVERTHALPGTAMCREIVVAGATLLFVWNARTHCQGPPCVEKSLSVDCRDDPVICVKRTHALPGTALCREIVVGRLQRRLCYLCGTHARIARDCLV